MNLGNAIKLTVLLIGVVVTTGCADHRKSASIYLRTAVPTRAVVLTCSQDEGTFWCVLQLAPQEAAIFSKAVKKNAAWHPMPLASELIVASDHFQPQWLGLQGEHIPVENTNGFYLFLDVESEYGTQHPYSGSVEYLKQSFHKRGGLNYVFGYFDDIKRKIFILYCHT